MQKSRSRRGPSASLQRSRFPQSWRPGGAQGTPIATFDYEIDLKPGGRWSCKAQNPKTVTSVGGEYLVVEPPRVLSYTWEPGWDSLRGMVVRSELTPTPSGTRVLLTHTGWGEAVQARQNHTDGWNRVLGWLEGYLGKTA
ncbi:MAG TPA: SRPBCC family protein [Terriglobia bacterium]